jgi:hypothetical protein
VNPRSYGRLAVGALLVLVGVLWLLQTIDVIDIPLRAITPVALIGIGLALIAGSSRGSYPILVIVGAILVVMLAVGSVFDGGSRVGDRVERPVFSGPSFSADYSHGAGRVEVDLRSVNAERADVRADVGAGRLEVIVPDGVRVRAVFSIGVGNFEVFGQEGSGGLGVDETYTSPETNAATRFFDLRLHVGVGSIEVRYGTPDFTSVPNGFDQQRQRELEQRLQDQQRELQERLQRQQLEMQRRQEELQRRFQQPEASSAPA